MKKYIINPQTGNIVNANGKIGKTIIKQKESKNQISNFTVKKCVGFVFLIK